MKAFVSLGFSKDEIDAIHNITAASIHCGELILDNSTFDDGKNAAPVSIKNMKQMELICGLLGIKDVPGFVTELVNKGAIAGIKGRTPEKPS
jgi:myosin heavy subunit